MDAYTKAIEVFEQAAVEIIEAYAAKSLNNETASLEEIVERDEQTERCLWAIEQLDRASKASRLFTSNYKLEGCQVEV